MRTAVFLSLVLLTGALQLHAQSLGNAGTITGTVTDPTGAALPNATITVHNPVTGYSQTVTTESNGSFRLVNLPPNPYHLQITASGFATFTEDVVIRNSLPLKVKAELALADYGMASRTAFANAKDLASGEAHLYRGIMLYRRKDFARAEDEFASALNFEIAGPQRGDAEAWRHLAAVAGGACGVARESLDRSLAGASPYFPRDEARQLEASCEPTASAKAAER